MKHAKLRWFHSHPLRITDDECVTERNEMLNLDWCTTHHCFSTTCPVLYV